MSVKQFSTCRFLAPMALAGLVLVAAAPAQPTDADRDAGLAREAKGVEASAQRANAARVERRIAEEFSTPGRPVTVLGVRSLARSSATSSARNARWPGPTGRTPGPGRREPSGSRRRRG
jgi:hypothetical protein